MAGRKMSTAPVMLPEDITANDYIWFLDVSDTSEGAAGTWKLLPADSFESVLSERQTVVRTIHYSNMNFNLPELPMIADAINNSGPYTVNANQRIIFKTSFYEISAVAGVGADRGVSVRSRYYRVHTNQKDFGIGYPAVKVGDISPAGESVSQPVVIDLGDIGSGNVWTAFNLGNPDDAFNPWVVNGETYVMAISNSDEVVWRFVGGDGIWGGSSGKMATSDDFLLQMKTTSELDDATVIHNLNLSAVDPTLPELKQIVSAVISQGPFYALPGQQMIFRVTEGNLNDGFIYEKYYRLLKNITSIGGTNIIQRNITDGWFMPDGILKYEMPLPESGDASILDLGDIGSDNVWDVFNLGDENEDPWDMREFKFVKTIENSESKYYVFLGSDRFYGGENKPATASDFSEVQETASRFFASQPVFLEYDTIADLLTENAKSPDMVILVKDAVADDRINFSGIAPSRRMAFYRFYGNDPENISSYLLISAPYAATGSGSSEIEEDIFVDVNVGALTAGATVLEGTTLTEFVKSIVSKTFNPTFVAPTLSGSAGGNVEVGTPNKTITVTFNRGRIDGALVGGVWNPSTKQADRAGAATKYTINGIDNGTNTSLEISKPTVLGSNSVPVRVDYAAGAQPKNSKNENYDSPLPAGFLTANANWTGFYYRTAIAGNSVPTASQVRASSYRRNNAGVINLPSGTTNVRFDVFVEPGKNLTQVLDTGNLNLDITDEFILQAASFPGLDAGGNTVNYKHYVRIIDNPYSTNSVLAITVT